MYQGQQPSMFEAPVRRPETDAKRLSAKKRAALADKLSKGFEGLESLALADRVEIINAVRERLHAVSPFRGEPVDLVRWVLASAVEANDYNPNAVAPPEMELLRLSIEADGFTQPIVTNKEETAHVVIDGFHRNRVGKECEDVVNRLMGYLPVVQIRNDQTDKPDRMASTVRHNRARGKHRVDAMSEIVLELKRRNWSNDKIGKQLGMDPDEVLRLTQIAGLADMFADREFSEAWEAGTMDDDLGSEIDGTIEAIDAQ